MTTREWSCPATVVRVHDGDTIVAAIDLGYRVSITSAVRLEGIAAAELHGPHRREAIAAWEALEELLPVGASIEVRSHGLDVGEELVGRGLVRRWSGTGKKPS